MVFIDTAGRSHNNKSQIEDLKKVLTNIEDKKVFLVLSANTSIDDIYDIVDTYSFVEDYEIIVTKTDETLRMGNILDIIKKTGKNISYRPAGPRRSGIRPARPGAGGDRAGSGGNVPPIASDSGCAAGP